MSLTNEESAISVRPLRLGGEPPKEPLYRYNIEKDELVYLTQEHYKEKGDMLVFRSQLLKAVLNELVPVGGSPMTVSEYIEWRGSFETRRMLAEYFAKIEIARKSK